MRLRLVMIFAKDMRRMTEFYRDKLGLREVTAKTAPDWVELEAGGASIALHKIPEHIARDIVITDPPGERSDGAIKVVFVVEDLEGERARLISLGVPMHEPSPWGFCDGLDPEGNRFQLTTL